MATVEEKRAMSRVRSARHRAKKKLNAPPKTGKRAPLTAEHKVKISISLRGPISTSTLPDAPIKATAVSRQHVFGVVDWSLAGSVVATHLIDFTSTETCISTAVCREAILPQALVHSKPAFMAYELGTASLEIVAQYELSRHGHRQIARVLQAVNVGLTARTVEHNYQQASLPLSLHGLQPLHAAN